jgi:hypothetical protein
MFIFVFQKSTFLSFMFEAWQEMLFTFPAKNGQEDKNFCKKNSKNSNISCNAFPGYVAQHFQQPW